MRRDRGAVSRMHRRSRDGAVRHGVARLSVKGGFDMLEAELAADAARAILDNMAQANALRVVSAEVVVGAMRQVDEALLVQKIGEALRGTAAQGTQIKLVRPAATMRCKACGTVYEITLGDRSTFACPSCGGSERTLNGGMEFGIGEMQVLLPSEHEGPSWADRLAKAVDDALGPAEKPADEATS